MHDEDEQQGTQAAQHQVQQHQDLTQQAEEEQEAQQAQEVEPIEAGAAWFEQLRQQNAELMAAREQEQEQDGPEL
ncbi:hypothetical protein VB151_09405 [Xanthomonas fragariae]|uniref:Uncharacterized protein n=2 Tax=Xanthomonas fragariae TaxID=48664 RepID=A0A1Y6HDL4_9XANT|nr:hypothetical protein [Xanthomonas fragariae]AOD16786.1 hypothetical protein BER92_19490 [Xanthomonas fragariae]AOD20184.1 hypothetical protein BER93_19530 [Xanthomonas fragariae]ENZ95999.1 hypothetical protein O1K_07107 [Xanthomonas fragariae LMG 25863]MBL9223085.1 hypothetical protein [Xanthomonas fragariae]MEA5219303.1 hypothetical protein [Xanthomonas fragariae]